MKYTEHTHQNFPSMYIKSWTWARQMKHPDFCFLFLTLLYSNVFRNRWDVWISLTTGLSQCRQKEQSPVWRLPVYLLNYLLKIYLFYLFIYKARSYYVIQGGLQLMILLLQFQILESQIYTTVFGFLPLLLLSFSPFSLSPLPPARHPSLLSFFNAISLASASCSLRLHLNDDEF